MKQELKTVYFLSGLGADSRAFSYLDLSFCNPVYLPWFIPEQKESIEDYALRYKSLITESEPVLVGLSFGGMVAMEIAKHVNLNKVIVISSAKTRSELPIYLRFLRWMPLHRIIPVENIKRLNNLAYKILRVNLRKDKQVCIQMIQESDNELVRWTIDRIINWKNKTVAKNTFHIHGSHDILLPYMFVHADYTIKKGRHMMPMIQPQAISSLLQKLITGELQSTR